MLPARTHAGQYLTLEESYQRAKQWIKNAQADRQNRIDEEKKDWRRDREAVEHRLARARETVLQSFDVYDRGILATSPVIREKFRKEKEHREAMLHRLLEYPAHAKGSIANGDAENFFLELCGSAAFAGEFDRNNKNPNAKRDPNQNYLSTITGEYRIPGNLLHHIIYRRGLTGPRLTGRLTQEPLDIQFPEVLRTPYFERYTTAIARCRDNVLRELRTGKPVSADVADSLLKMVNDLLVAIKERMSAVMAQAHTNNWDRMPQLEWGRLKRAEAPVQALLQGAFRLIEATNIDDVALPKLKETDGVTIEELIAYMHSNNLYFHPADLNGEPAYALVFEMMSRYYVDLVTLKNCEQGLQALEEEERRVKQVRLTMEAVGKMAELAKQEANLADSLSILGGRP
jgi:hypothetical protein